MRCCKNLNLTNSSTKGLSKSYIKGWKVMNECKNKLINLSCSSDLAEITRVIVSV